MCMDFFTFAYDYIYVYCIYILQYMLYELITDPAVITKREIYTKCICKNILYYYTLLYQNSRVELLLLLYAVCVLANILEL